jgi:hypothetical protein
MGNAAARHHNVFVSAGLPADFVAQLEVATDAIVKTLNVRDQIRGKAGTATTSLEKRLSEARKVVHVLDSFVQKALKRDPVLLRNWNLVKRVQKTAVQTDVPAAPHVTAA